MQAIVEAAIISGSFGLMGISGTALVAIAGFRANRRISNESARAAETRAYGRNGAPHTRKSSGCSTIGRPTARRP